MEDNHNKNEIEIQTRDIPEELKYENIRKQGIQNVKFSRMGKREYVFLKSPYPGQGDFEPLEMHEGRFKLAPLDIDCRS